MLLLTDRRWRAGSGRLAREIAVSGILADEHLDLLAATFLAAGDAVFWQVPDDWFADGIDIVIRSDAPDQPTHPDEQDDEQDDEHPDEQDDDSGVGVDEPDRPTVARRDLPPPLRRWATTHLIRIEPSRWGAMIARAEELTAPHRAAVIAGLMDAVDSLEPPAQSLVVERALASRDHGVRRLALQHLADHGDVDRAYALAVGDPNRRIRDWADDLRQPSPGEGHSDDPAAIPQRLGETRRRRSKDLEPPTLF